MQSTDKVILYPMQKSLEEERPVLDVKASMLAGQNVSIRSINDNEINIGISDGIAFTIEKGLVLGVYVEKSQFNQSIRISTDKGDIIIQAR